MTNAVKNAEISAPATEITYFSPGNYFIGIVDQIMSGNKNARIDLANNGAVILLASQNIFYSQVRDMEQFCRAPASQFTIRFLNQADITSLHGHGKPKNIKDLLWQAAFYASEGRLIESCTNGGATQIYDVIKLHHWPNLTRLPITANTMRICALLSRSPSSIMLIHRKLGIEAEEVFQIYSAACSAGLVRIMHNNTADETPHIENGNIKKVTVSSSIFRSLFNKLSGL